MPTSEAITENWHTEKPHVKCCKMPYQVRDSEVKLYKTLLHSHCDHPDKRKGNHDCSGAITISENALILRCKKCGDAKGVFGGRGIGKQCIDIDPRPAT